MELSRLRGTGKQADTVLYKTSEHSTRLAFDHNDRMHTAIYLSVIIKTRLAVRYSRTFHGRLKILMHPQWRKRRNGRLTQAVDIGEVVRQAILVLALIIAAAKLGGELLARLGQPPVLGELLIGVVLGNLNLFGITLLEPLRDNVILRVVAEIGAILLLFEVGVESDLVQLSAVGWSSLVVATLGVLAPMILGYFGSTLLIPDAGWLSHLFVGGTLTATSVGITARVLKDLNKANAKEARIILGAAVADDVIGLVVLAVVSGLVSAAVASSGATSVSWISVLWIVAKATIFLALAVLVGRFWSQTVFVHAARLQISGALLAFAFVSASLWRGLRRSSGSLRSSGRSRRVLCWKKSITSPSWNGASGRWKSCCIRLRL